LLRRLIGIGKPKAPQDDGGLAALARLLVAQLRTAGTMFRATLAAARTWFPLRPAAAITRPNGFRSTGC